MQRNTPIRLKAAFLLVVFALNTLVGFACSLGVDMGFNTSHHHEEESAIVENHSHHHGHEVNHDHKSKSENSNCCNDGVIKFAQVDKSSPQSLKAGISPIFITTFVSSFYNIDLLHTSQTPVKSKYFLRSYHPPISDIRIAIQSFQI